jgi:hypothetical protein
MMIMLRSPLVKYSLSFLQSVCVHLNPYDLQHHCGKEVSFCIRDKSILFLGHRGAYDIKLAENGYFAIRFIT